MSSRAYLAAYSPVLDTTFDNDFREGQQRAVAYDDIDPSDFAEFLLAIYPVQKDIEAEYVPGLARLADRFHVKSFMKKCLAFLETDTELLDINKLLLADELNLVELRAKLINQLTESDMKLLHYPHIFMKPICFTGNL
ncbi:Protein BATH-38 [Aphelenchoides avenae]|nr:Protein BATH-38 [Aphelenchus avenae]